MKNENEIVKITGEVAPVNLPSGVQEAGVEAVHEHKDIQHAVSEIHQVGVPAEPTKESITPSTQPQTTIQFIKPTNKLKEGKLPLFIRIFGSREREDWNDPFLSRKETKKRAA